MADNQYGLNPTAKNKKSGYRWLYLVFMVLLAFASMSYATQDVAAFYGYQSALGQPWGTVLGIPFYAPWSIFVWSNAWPDTTGQFEVSITIGQSIFLVPQFIILGCWFTRRRLKGNKDLHGSAKWADEEEIQGMGYFGGKGVYIGGWLKKLPTKEVFANYSKWFIMLICSPLFIVLPFLFKSKRAEARTVSDLLRAPRTEIHYYLRDDGPTHCMVFAPTRSGKGVGLILPTLLSWLHSTLVLDIKGENWALTSGFLKKIGNLVLRFDPSDSSGASACFNPLEEMPLDTLHAISEIQNLAQMLVDPEGKGLADHWTKAAFAFFSGLIMHCCIMVPSKEKRPATLSDLVLMMADETRTTEELLTEMLEADHEAILKELYPTPEGAHHVHTFIASSAREMLNKDEKESSGVLSTAVVNMALYRDPIVAMNTSRSDFKLNDLMNHEKPLNLYFVMGPADQERMKPLMRLMMDMIIRRICKKMEFADGASVAGYKHRMLLMLDEFTSLGKLPIIEKAIAYIAGYGGKMFLIVQSTVQLNQEYGKDNALMANCHVRIAYAPNQMETANLLSEMTGKTTVVETKTSLSGSRLGSMKNASMSVSETARALLTPDECMRIPGIRENKRGKVIPGDMLIFTAGQPAIYGKQILYFKDPTFSARAKIKAPGVSKRFPDGITDSVYYPRPAEWYSETSSVTSPVVHQAPVSEVALETAKNTDSLDYFQ